MKSLKKSLSALIITGLLAFVLVGALAYWGSMQKTAAVARGMVAKDVVADILPPPLYLVEMRLLLSMALDGSVRTDAALKEHAKLSRDFEERAQFWRANPPYGLETHLLGEQHQLGADFIKATQAALQLADEQGPGAARDQLKELHWLYLEHRKAVDATIQVANHFAQETLRAYEATDRLQTQALLLTSLLAAGAFVALGLAVLRGVLKATGGEPSEVARVANAVAEGDLTVAVAVSPGDEHSVMAAMARMRERLHALVSEVRASSQAIASGSQQVACGGEDLRERTEQQAASLQQTASVMEEFEGTLQNSAATAAQADEVARGAQGAAQRGANVMGQVVSTMQGINNGSRRIGEITAMIDGIAFQTNILALNAAVEAARAGEQGRGFAVVAAEVRSLAQRSAAAAKEISGLINQSVGEVSRGTQLVNEAGATMTDLVGQVEHVTAFIGEISASTREQAQGIGLVSNTVSQLDSATQQNAALVEQSVAASASLSESAKNLVQMVSRFKLARV